MRLYSQKHTTAAISPPPFQACATEEMIPIPGRVQSPAEDGLVCASYGHSIFSSRGLLLPNVAKSPAPADPTCGPFPSCLGDLFTPYSWHLLPLPWGTSQATNSAHVPSAHRQLLQEDVEATQVVPAAGPASLVTSKNTDNLNPAGPKRWQGFCGPQRMGPQLSQVD